MQIYIATPVNARKEATLAKKQRAAFLRVKELKQEILRHLPDAEVVSVFSMITVGRKVKPEDEPRIMGACIQMVMESDIILMDDGWGDSHGCKVERFTAQEYGKQIWTLFDLEGLQTKEE